MKLLIALLAIVVTVSPAPQGLNTQNAEFVPTKNSTNMNPFPNRGVTPDGVNVQVPRIPQFSLLDLLFGNDRVGRTPQTSGRDPQGGDDLFTQFFGGGNFFPFRFLRPDFSDIPFFSFPSFPNLTAFDDIPGGYKNSTFDVKVVNGSRVEVNQTVSKSDDDDSFFRTVIVKVTPEEDGPVGGNKPVAPSPLPKDGVPKTVGNSTGP